MPHSSIEPCEGRTARLAEIISADARFVTHPSGHTKKVLRYQCARTLRPIAIEKRKGAPVVYVESSAAPHRRDFAKAVVKAAGIKERNSNLRAAFADAELLAVLACEDREFQILLDLVA